MLPAASAAGSVAINPSEFWDAVKMQYKASHKAWPEKTRQQYIFLFDPLEDLCALDFPQL